MRPRDVIVTPTWNWHDHGKKGADEEGGDDQPVIWLDGLDLPNFVHFPVHFVEHFAKARYPAEDKEESPILFPWKDMQAKLEASQAEWTTAAYLKADGRESEFNFHTPLEFSNVSNPSIPEYLSVRVSSILTVYLLPVGRVIGALAERITAGGQSPVVRETASSVYHIIEGSGHSKIGDVTLSWKQGDTFCIPAWHQYQHFADDSGKVYLYRFDDKPMLKALGFYRVEGDDVEKFVSD